MHRQMTIPTESLFPARPCRGIAAPKAGAAALRLLAMLWKGAEWLCRGRRYAPGEPDFIVK
ncbi:MAG: hypothetical protein R3D63_08175 [Paracoccaceae bacterium]